MNGRIERLIAMAFDDWKKDGASGRAHPGEEEIACFLEGKLGRTDADRIKEHVAVCDACAELVVAGMSIPPGEELPVPEELLARARGLAVPSVNAQVLDIVLTMKTFGFSIISTTGDVLLGQEFVPAAVLRTRDIRDFKDEIVILKDFSEIRIEVKAQSQPGLGFNLSILARNKRNQKALKDVRISLFKEGVELESRVADTGRAVFEHVYPGLYSVEISGIKEKLARVSLEVRV
jgi:hypothetical protein